MSRITMSLENDFEGRVLASFDLDEFANKVRADAIDLITELKNKYEHFSHEEYYVSAMVSDLEDLIEQLKE